MPKNGATRGPLWLIAKHNNGRTNVLTLDPNGGEKSLPIFSHEEEAEAFLWLETPGKDWQARETTAGELASLLSGPRADAKKVELDPLPMADCKTIVDLAGPGRESFLRRFLGVSEPSSTPRSTLRAGATIGS